MQKLKPGVLRKARASGERPAEAWARCEREWEIAQSLARCEALGIRATYHACDVADRQAIAAMVAQIRDEHGPIDGVVHGAGVEQACKFPKKTEISLRRSIGAKVEGALALMEALGDEPPRHFIGFTSTSGRFGGLGQADYSLANALLAGAVARYRGLHPQCGAVCLDWSAWGDVGMAARPESKFALQKMGLVFMPSAEGVDHLIDELLHVGQHAEVLVLDHPGLYASHPTMSEVDRKPASLARTPAQTDRSNLAPGEDAPPTHVEPRSTGSASFALGRRVRKALRQAIEAWSDAHGHDSDSWLAAIPKELAPLAAIDSLAQLRELAAGAEVLPESVFAWWNAWQARAHPPTLPPPRATVRRAPPTRATRLRAPETASRELPTTDFPLLDSAELQAGGVGIVARTTLHPATDVFLLEHKLHRRPLLPAVVSIEMLAEAAVLLRPDDALVGFDDIDLLNGHTFLSDRSVQFRCGARALDDGNVEGELSLDDAGSQSRLVTGRVAFSTAPVADTRVEIKSAPFGWTKFYYPDDWAVLHHGKSLRTFGELMFQHGGGLARLTAPPRFELAGKRRGERWLTPSALIDGCMVACGTYSYFMLEQRVEIPRRIGRLRLFAAPASRRRVKCSSRCAASSAI